MSVQLYALESLFLSLQLYYRVVWSIVTSSLTTDYAITRKFLKLFSKIASYSITPSVLQPKLLLKISELAKRTFEPNIFHAVFFMKRIVHGLAKDEIKSPIKIFQSNDIL